MHNTPYWRLSALYFCYFSVFGVFVPYTNRFFSLFGWNPADVAQLIAAVMAAQFVGPFTLAKIGDVTGRRMQLMRWTVILLLASMVVAALAPSSKPVVLLAGVMFGLSISAALPQLEATTLHYLGDRQQDYGRVRLWGSMGFAIMALTVGQLMAVFGYLVFVGLMLFFAVLMWLMTWTLAQQVEADPHSDTPVVPVMHTLKQPVIILLLLTAMFWQFSFAAYNTFFDGLLLDNNYPDWGSGVAIFVGVIAEVAMFMVVAKLFDRIGVLPMLVIALVLTSLRWSAIVWVMPWLPLQIGLQSLHAFSYGLTHAAFIYLIGVYFHRSQQVRGQAIYQASSTGAGLIAGNLLAGQLIVWFSMETAFYLAGVAAAIAAGFAIAMWYVGRQSQLGTAPNSP